MNKQVDQPQLQFHMETDFFNYANPDLIDCAIMTCQALECTTRAYFITEKAKKIKPQEVQQEKISRKLAKILRVETILNLF